MLRRVPWTVLFLLALPTTGYPQELPTVLRHMPTEATLVITIDQPERLIDTVQGLEVYRQLGQIPQVRTLVESTPVKRFQQLVQHFERETGQDWPALVKSLTGNGVALGTVFGKVPAPTLLITEGTDEAIVARAHDLLLQVIQDEAGTSGEPATIRKKDYLGVPVVNIGKEFFSARVGSTIYIANQQEPMKHALELRQGQSQRQAVTEHATLSQAYRLVGAKPLVWAWLDLAKVKANPQAEDFFANTRSDFLQTLVVGSTIDAIRRSDYLAVGLQATPEGLSLAVKLPARRSDLDHAMALHVPAGKGPGSLPLLEPEGVVLSQSFYLDLAHLWKERESLLNDEIRPQIEKADRDLAKVLPGTTLGKLLEQSGPYHRLVMAHTGEKHYTQEPGQLIPPVALVTTMRDPAFGKSMNGILRGGAFLAGFETGWKMKETEFDKVPIVSYQFPDTQETKLDDPDRLRFNTVPSFAIVEDSLVLGSTPGIVERVITELRKTHTGKPSAKVWRLQAYGAGAGTLLDAYPEPSISDAVLSQGISLAEAQKQVRSLARWIKTLGQYELSIDHGDEAFVFELAWRYSK